MKTDMSDLITSQLKSIVSSSVVDVEIDISPDNKDSLVLVCGEKYKNQIKVSFSSGILRFNAEGNFNNTGDLKLLVKSSSLEEIIVSGTSNVSGNYKGARLKIKLSGTGNINLSGKVEHLDVNVLGTGDASLKELEAKSVILKLSGTSNAKVFAYDSCNVKISGIGDATVYGSPENFQQKVSGLGTVNQVNGKNKNKISKNDSFNSFFEKEEENYEKEEEQQENNKYEKYKYELDEQMKEIMKNNQDALVKKMKEENEEPKLTPSQILKAKIKRML